MGGKVLELESERLIRIGKEKGEAVGRAAGKAEGRAEGKAEGKAEGEQRSQRLNRRLLDDGRMEDLIKSTYDEEFRRQLYAEYGIS